MKKYRIRHRMLVLMFAFALSAALIGCGRNSGTSTSEDGYVEDSTGTDHDGVLGDAADDVGDGIVDGVDDVVDGVGDAIDDIGSGLDDTTGNNTAVGTGSGTQ